MAALVLQAQVGGCLDAADWAGGNFNSPPFGDLHVFSVTTLQRRETTGTLLLLHFTDIVLFIN